jgi:hypothetical protein
MKKKIFLYLITFVVLLAVIVGGWFYYYQYVEEVTERYLIKYTIPHETESMYGAYISKPEVEFVSVNKYSSDSIAIQRETKAAIEHHQYILKKFENEKFDDESEFMNITKRNAYVDLLNEKRILISISHVRSLDAKEALSLIKKHGIFSDDIIEYAEKNKLKTNIYPIN